MNRILDAISGFFWPKRCLFCREVTGGEDFCPKCAKGVSAVEDPICPKCGGGILQCRCRERDLKYDRCVSPFYYENSIRKMLIDFKGTNKTDTARFLCGHMTRRIHHEYKNINFDLICDVPMYHKKKEQNGFNHAETLANEMSRRLKIEHTNAALKKTADVSQHTQKSETRADRVLGLYAAGNCDITGKTILLVDDIITTGNTLSECAKILKQMGAKSVYCVTAAYTPFGVVKS